MKLNFLRPPAQTRFLIAFKTSVSRRENLRFGTGWIPVSGCEGWQNIQVLTKIKFIPQDLIIYSSLQALGVSVAKRDHLCVQVMLFIQTMLQVKYI